MRRATRGTWNVRTTPWRANVAMPPSSSTPSSVTVPPSRGTTPVTTSKSVLLPEPLGPISPVTWPGGASIETPSRTVTSPIALHHPASAEPHAASSFRQPGRGGAAAPVAQMADLALGQRALGTEHQDQDERHADDEALQQRRALAVEDPELRDVRGAEEDRLEQQRAEHRAVHVPAPADDHHRPDDDHLVEREDVRRDQREPERQQRAARRGDRAADGQHDRLDRERVAARARRAAAGSSRASSHHAAELGAAHPLEHEDDDDDHRRRDREQRAGRLRRDAVRRRARRRRWRPRRASRRGTAPRRRASSAPSSGCSSRLAGSASSRPPIAPTTGAPTIPIHIGQSWK